MSLFPWRTRQRNRAAYQAAHDAWWPVRTAMFDKRIEMSVREGGHSDDVLRMLCPNIDLSQPLDDARRELAALEWQEAALRAIAEDPFRRRNE
jgi:hypothetical protein